MFSSDEFESAGKRLHNSGSSSPVSDLPSSVLPSSYLGFFSQKRKCYHLKVQRASNRTDLSSTRTHRSFKPGESVRIPDTNEDCAQWHRMHWKGTFPLHTGQNREFSTLPGKGCHCSASQHRGGDKTRVDQERKSRCKTRDIICRPIASGNQLMQKTPGLMPCY